MKRNVILLAICQALMMSGNSLIITTTALAGLLIAPEPAWATIPFALQYVGMIVTTYPASMMMQRSGRKTGFMLGAGLGIAGAILSTTALIQSDFVLFCCGAFLLGAFSAFGQYYRFAAAEVASETFKSRAISYVMAGGVVAAFIGPNLARTSRDLINGVEFAGCYAAVVGLYVLSFFIVMTLKLPSPTTAPKSVHVSASLREILQRPIFITAVVSGAVGYGVMNLIMTSTPLAMSEHGFSFSHTAHVIQWHVFAMFAPSFITGHLIARFGAHRIMLAGTFILLACCSVNLSGTQFWHFLAALALLGFGWNFCFVGATSLLAGDSVSKGKVQGLNDFIIFFVVGITALSSGFLQHNFGWTTVNLMVIPFIFAAMFVIIRGQLNLKVLGSEPNTL